MTNPMEQYAVVNLENELKAKDALLRELVASLEGLAEDTKPTGPMADAAVRTVLLDILRRAQAAMKGTSK